MSIISKGIKVKQKIKFAFWVIVSIPFISIVLRVFVCDSFIIRGDSMCPEYFDGEKIWVNKLLAGPRIYTKFDFISPELHSVRLPGIRDIKVGDVVVFNCPYGRGRRVIEFKINYVYVKRCLGAPGDSISIENSYYKNSTHKDPFGCISSQNELIRTPDSLITYKTDIYPFSKKIGWTMREMGPLYVPKEGTTVTMDQDNTIIYDKVIEYETGYKPIWESGCIHNGHHISEYTFKGNYYYLVGDNVLNSKDSRYFGFVPEEYIIGIGVN